MAPFVTYISEQIYRKKILRGMPRSHSQRLEFSTEPRDKPLTLTLTVELT